MIAIKRIFSVCIIAFIVLMTSCNKNNYFHDSGTQVGSFNGTVLDYLKSKPEYFDSVAKIIHIAAMDDIFSKEEITFFAPSDSSVRSSIAALNKVLYNQGRTIVTRLEQIKPAVWRAQLARYLFKGKKSMNDYLYLFELFTGFGFSDNLIPCVSCAAGLGNML